MRERLLDYQRLHTCPHVMAHDWLKLELLPSTTFPFMSLPRFRSKKLEFFANLSLDETEQIGERILKEINERLGFLSAVGLNYLTLDRKAGSLSGGESQRIRFSTR